MAVRRPKSAKNKRFVKVVTNKKTGRKRRIYYGQKGASIRPGTPKGDSYCARSLGIKRRLPKSKRNGSVYGVNSTTIDEHFDVRGAGAF